MGKDRKLNAQERALWHHVTKSVTPIHPQKYDVDDKAVLKRAARSKKSVSPTSTQTYHQPPQHPPHIPKKLAPLDGATLRKLRRGKMHIDGRLDLHGHRQAEAHRALEDFIAYSRKSGRRCVLVITGKGSFNTLHMEGMPGILRQRVPEWLRSGALAQHVVGVEQAHPRHGGGGAPYVILRKA